MVLHQTLEFFSGYPALLGINAPAELKRAKLDGRPLDVYKTRSGASVEVCGLSRDYHLYILASRTTAFFMGGPVNWDRETRTACTRLRFFTYPTPTDIDVLISLDGSSPYPLPSELDVKNIVSVRTQAPEPGGLPKGLVFVHSNGKEVGLYLYSGLLHYLRFPPSHTCLTDFNVEYVGIACGESGSRNVFDRAVAHEKVVEISGVIHRDYGNRELFLFAYDPGYIAYLSTAPVFTMPGILHEIVGGKMNSLFEAMEATLISYFQPKYNFEFKTFPRTRPKWLQGNLYSFDGPAIRVNRIRVTLASDCSFNTPSAWVFGKFRSGSRAAQAVHTVAIQQSPDGWY